MAIIVSLDQYRHSFEECGLLRAQAVLALVDQLFHCGNHTVVLFLGLDGFDDNAIREPGVFLGVDGQCSAHSFHAPLSYSLCVNDAADEQHISTSAARRRSATNKPCHIPSSAHT